MSRYKELIKEKNKLIDEIQPFSYNSLDCVLISKSLTKKELNRKVKRINKISSILKKIDNQIKNFTTPRGNYKSSFVLNKYKFTLKSSTEPNALL